ncbi:DUF4976 domain-containing protein [Paenibacillus sp. H1-7]|uniref:sulfatase-like hydrolase/transferase n=1 Tax=Paenibacillus sp. H1-7 TaxID=2282849 RepID=UPI001EF875D4|nr:sulfatase-like hydrolase/transferase [Paenibacillus sp. H1-7]ULL15992.1 DUF4976 domain-containing protein [Paenibacillus sp. H1-7]
MNKQKKQPNVLFIISDDHRHDAIHCAGDSTVHTPHLDALAAGGVRFAGTHIMGGWNGAVCVPSRACVHSGVSVFRCVEGNTIAPQLALLPETLRSVGYHTYAVGKWHNDRASFNRSFAGGSRIFWGGMSGHYHVPLHDFDASGTYSKENAYYLDSHSHSTDVFTDAAVSFLEAYDQDNPFMLYLAYTAPHDPRTAPEEFRSMYRDEDIPLPPNFMPEHPFDNGEMKIRDEDLEAYPRTPEAIKRHIADYYAMISHMDDGIGRVLQTLHERGLMDNTIIVYTADHGLAVGQHGLMGKQNMYDHSIRIPLIMKGCGIPEGIAVTGLTYQIDIFPTLCDLTGTPIPATVEGMSLLPHMSGNSKEIRTTVGSAYKDIQRTIKDNRWKLIQYHPDQGVHKGEKLQLFDLLQDPWETKDLSDQPDYDQIKQRLVHELLNWRRSAGDPLLQ